MDAKTLFEQGVVAIKRGDRDEARRLLQQSAKLDPDNATTWLWVSRVQTDPKRQRQCIQRALVIDPENRAAKQILARLNQNNGAVSGASSVAVAATAVAVSPPVATDDEENPFADVIPASKLRRNGRLTGDDGELNTDAPFKRKPAPAPPTPAQQREIRKLLEKAELFVEQERNEEAVECWVRVLQTQVDHEYAMKHAVKSLTKLGYVDDAEELVIRAIDAGTHSIPIHLTAMDLARYGRKHVRLGELRRSMVTLPGVEDTLISRLVDELIEAGENDDAHQILGRALKDFPQSQALLVQMGDVQKALGRPREAMTYYNQAAALGTRSKEGREADKRLGDFAPVLTDKERGNVLLAWREAVGFAIFFFLLAWQDVGLDLGNMTPERWLGIVFGLVGGYLLVTATSSPQQRGLAKLLGGKIPDAPYKGASIIERGTGAIQEVTQIPIIAMPLRVGFGVAGVVILGIGAWLVFNTAIDLLFFNPVEPDLSQLWELMYSPNSIWR